MEQTLPGHTEVIDGKKPLPAHRVQDVQAAEKAAREMLVALGASDDEEVMRNTPRRMVQAYKEFFTPQPFHPTVFDNHDGYDELVVAYAIPFRSICEHHFLPFIGTASVGYIPGAHIIGLSKLARAVEFCASRPQVQERLVVQIADWLEENLQPRGIGVVLEAEHTCMTLRGVRSRGARTRTSALRGLVRSSGKLRAEFMALALHGASPGGVVPPPPWDGPDSDDDWAGGADH
ncbi:GTP cyclohydrolase I [Streptomyces sp. NPDC057654]|uniref:GTP cyclohydrolase I n=1 Tax=Streptomyces sp. NPDC057654 TaxID=3346196 RepID=UPI0036968530